MAPQESLEAMVARVDQRTLDMQETMKCLPALCETVKAHGVEIGNLKDSVNSKPWRTWQAVIAGLGTIIALLALIISFTH
jgi:hypothetical protein